MSRQILVIDDEESISIIVTAALEVTANWQVTSTTSGTEGIAMNLSELGGLGGQNTPNRPKDNSPSSYWRLSCLEYCF